MTNHSCHSREWPHWSEAAEVCVIPCSTDYVLLQEFDSGNGIVLPKFFSSTFGYLIKSFDDIPSTVLEHARDELCNKFEGFSICFSGTHIQRKLHDASIS
jgi:hypothetical protein